MLQSSGSDVVNWAGRLLLAQGVIVVLFLLDVASFSMPHAADFKPFFLLMAIYYWAIYRPTVMPLIFTFVLGFVMDCLTGLPPGLNALLFVGIQTVVRQSRLFLMGQPYVMVWLGFALVAIVYGLLLWLAAMLFAGVLPIWPVMVAAAFSAMIFPAICFLLQAVHRILPAPASGIRS